MGLTKSPSFLLPLAFLSLFSVVGLAQDRPSLTLNFEQAVELALKNYPAIRAAQAQRRAAERDHAPLTALLSGSICEGRFFETLDVVFRSTSSNHHHRKQQII